MTELEAMLDGDVQKAYVTFLNKGNFPRVKELFKFTKVKPNQETTNEGYKYFIEHIFIDNLIKLGKMCKHKPSEEVIQEALQEHIKCYSIEFLPKLADHIKISPNEESIQIVYDYYLKNNRIEDAEALQEFTGVEPIINSESVKMAYQNCFERNWPWGINKVKEFTGVEPTEEKVQGVYTHLITKHSFDLALVLKDIIGIKPKISEENIQENYRFLFGGSYTSDAKKLMNLTGIMPSQELAEKFPEEYKLFVEACSNEN